jgi:2-methylcitrate dehydratase PrpD
MPLTITEQLALRLQESVQSPALLAARLHLLDWIGCVCGAWNSDVSHIAQKTEADAIIRYALLGNILEMDDVHRASVLHPGPVVWPAALWAARDHSASFGELLAAGVRGYEATIRIGETFDAHHYAHFHPTSTAGIFGAVAAAGSAMNFSNTQYIWGFGNAGSLAGGLWHMRHDPKAMTKQLHSAHAVQTGILIAKLTAQNFTGPSAILEGPQGLYAAMTATPKPTHINRAYPWALHEVSFKPWAACRHAHPAIDAALDLKKLTDLSNGEIIIETYRDALIFCDKPNPQTVLEAKFSLQHAVAIVALRGAPTLADFELDAILDPDIIAVRNNIRVREVTEFSSAYPNHFGARARANSQQASVSDALGDPESPLSQEAIILKAKTLMAWGHIPNANEIIDWVLTSDNNRPVQELLDLLP